ncbi:MAG: multidrug efflux protein [Opitutaceae bacterium]|nr:multidrug efflux protein [Opitutaceae bacterium]
MKFTDIFIRRPVLAIVVNLIIIIAGLQAIRSLNVRQYPKSEVASITVRTPYIGANADLVRGFVTSPLERAIAAADGIDYLESQSTQGLSTISARLKLNYDGHKALAEINSRVNQVRNDLPPEAELPAISLDPADSQFASMYLSFASTVLQSNEVTDYLARVVQPALTSLEGVQRAEILGGRTFAMRIWLKPDRLAAFSISPLQIRQALMANNVRAAVGSTKGSLIQVNLTANTSLENVSDFQQLVVREDHGTIVRLQDVADVVLGAEDYNVDVRFTGKQAIFMGIWVLPNANSLDVTKRVRAELDDLKKRFPLGFTSGIAYDGTKYIDNAIREVIKTLSETLLIVVLIIYLFLGSLRSALVPMVAIPVSLIGAVFLMQVFGFTVNLLTLLAIVLSVGLVVDDAIVVVENAERHLREGRSRLDAAIVGARELISPIISMSCTLAAVYTPIAFQGGLTGSLFREFAITLAGAVLISGFVALTLSPMLASHLLHTAAEEERGFTGVVNHLFDRLKSAYGRGLHGTLNARPVVYFVWGMLFLAVGPLFIFSLMTTELAPIEDQGVIFGILKTPANSTLDQLRPFATRINDVFFRVPEAEFSFQITFANGGFSGVVTKPWNERKRNIFEIRKELLPQLSMVPGVQIFPILPASLPGGGTFPVEFIIASTADPRQIYGIAQKVAAKAARSGLFAFPPALDVKIDEPQSQIVVDRDKVAALGLSLQQIGSDLGAMLGGGYVNRFSIDGRSYKVIPQIQRIGRLNAGQLRDIYVSGPQGKLVPLATFATIKNSTEPRSLNRFNQLNAVKIAGIPAAPLDAALKVLEQAAREEMPQGYTIDYGGESRQLRKEGSKFLPALGLALALIFLVLAAQFNSFRDPLVILLGSAPLAMFGAMIFTGLRSTGDPSTPNWTWGWTTSWNIYSQIGLITLIGLVAKNGILIVQFANMLQLQGRAKLAAVHEAAQTRLRPILMTTAATVFGHLMLVFVTGAGAAARNSIGLVLVCGMTIGTLFTLFIVPSLYMLIAKDHSKDRVALPAPEAGAAPTFAQ